MRILNAGARLADRYTLIRRLGAGESAEVWLAEDHRVQGQVALKFLAADFAADANRAALLHREWRIASRLMHANIVRIFEYHDAKDGAFYGQQFVGSTQIGVLTGAPPAEILAPIGLLADALRYAHGKGVIHRDIKAANILLDSRGLPYLTDFGVAADSQDAVAISGGGTEISSSPEQRAGAQATPADDVYALGVLINELLTGRPPRDGVPGQLLVSGEAMPADIVTLLGNMLATDPVQRPDAASIAQYLQRAGYNPGPAPARFVSGAQALNKAVESQDTDIAPRRYAAARPDPVAAPESSAGIAPGILYGGLAVAAVLLLIVVFVLPELSGTKAPDSAADSRNFQEPVTDPGEADGDADVVPDATVDATNTVAPAANRDASQTPFNENVESSGPTNAAQIKAATDIALGNLLSQLERLRYRAIERWGGQEYLDAVNVYAEGDQAYVDKNYRLAGEKYRRAIVLLEPFFDRIDTVFAETMTAAQTAFDASDYSEAIRLFDLATSITPGNRAAEAGLARAQTLESVLALMVQGEQYEDNLELDAALLAFQKALELDTLWEPAAAAIARVKSAINRMSFEQRMTEGFEALFAKDFASARAAFNAAKALDPASRQPADGLLQLDQEVRLSQIRRLEGEAKALDAAEQWESSITVYENILQIDPDLEFAHKGLSQAKSRAALHKRLSDLIADPDTLSDQVNIQKATTLLLDTTKIQPLGPRLNDQKNELSRLLKRAATPLPVQLVSDNLTNVAIFKIGQLGTFAQHNIDLRPGVYVAVGIRPGYRDVRIEFRVAPEVEMTPIVIQCEEAI